MDPYASPQSESEVPVDVEPTSWWHRPAGGKEVFTVALPLVISSLSWTVMTFVDRVFLKWESGDAMAAAFQASTAWFAVLCLPLGIAIYTSTFVSQYWGADRHDRIGLATWQGVWLALAATPLMLLAIPFAPMLFAFAGHGSQVMQLEITYFQILCWGAPAMLMGQALQSFYSGRGKTTVVMIVDTTVAVINLALDYLWIFGYWGFPAMGIAGAGWATVVSLWLKALIYVVLLLQRRHREQFGTATGIRFDRELFRRLIFYGGPSGLEMLLQVAGFTLFILLIGRLGDTEAEATGMAFSISTLAFMPVWGMSMAGSISSRPALGRKPRRPGRPGNLDLADLRHRLHAVDFGPVSLCAARVPGQFLPRSTVRGRPRLPDGNLALAVRCRLQPARCHGDGLCQCDQRGRRHPIRAEG